jgi:hypothetical protein
MDWPIDYFDEKNEHLYAGQLRERGESSAVHAYELRMADQRKWKAGIS